MLLRKMWLISIIALATTVIFCSCGQKADDITYTAKSSEALEIFLQGSEKDDAFYTAQARELYKNAIELDPKFAMAHYYLALSSPTTQEYLEHFNNAIRLSGSVSEPERLIILRAKALFENEIYLAREYTEKLAELLPNGKRNRYLNGNFYFGRQEWKAAENEYQTAITIDPKFAPAYNMLSYTLSNLEKYPESIETLKKYAELQPEDHNPHDSMGEIYLMMNDYENSIKSYSHALKLKPDFIASIVGIGHNYVFNGEYQKGRDEYDKIFKQAKDDTDSSTCYLWNAISFLHTQDYTKAIKVLKIRQKFARDHNNLYTEISIQGSIARVYLEKGDLDQALNEAAVQRKLSSDPHIYGTLQGKYIRNCAFIEAIALTRMDKQKVANKKIEEFEKSVRASNNPLLEKNLHCLKGIIAYWNKDYQNAISELIQVDSQNQYSNYYLGLCYKKTDEEQKAKEIFTKIARYNQNSLNYALVRTKALKEI